MSSEPPPPTDATRASVVVPDPDAPASRATWRAPALAGCAFGLSAAAGVAAWAAVRWAGVSPPVAAGFAAAAATLPLAAGLAGLARSLDAARAALRIAADGVAIAAGPPAVPSSPAPPRNAFLALAEREWARARRYGGSPALLLVDVDRFARLTETRGADATEALMQALANDITPTLRTADALGRFGGSQIAVWLVQADATGAIDAADRIRERCERLELRWKQQPLRLTASVGVAALRPSHQNLTQLVVDAEAAVQAARQAGGNCVRAAPVDLLASRRIGPSVGDNQAAGPL